ncbi:MAG: hypothetical protein KF705_07495 [Phycisphaeraceae bacterium]|nr:hypothetical protein [Phycisphaeraceae bacterium]
MRRCRTSPPRFSAQAEQRGGRIETVINTHHHLDHYRREPGSPPTRGSSRCERQAAGRAWLERLRQFLKSGVRTVSNSDGLTKEQALKDAEALAASADDDRGRSMGSDTDFQRADRLCESRRDADRSSPGRGGAHGQRRDRPRAAARHRPHGRSALSQSLPVHRSRFRANVRDWIKTLKYAKRLCKPKTIVVPGHGEG